MLKITHFGRNNLVGNLGSKKVWNYLQVWLLHRKFDFTLYSLDLLLSYGLTDKYTYIQAYFYVNVNEM